MEPCGFCGTVFDHESLGRYGCPNCYGEGLDSKETAAMTVRTLVSILIANGSDPNVRYVGPQISMYLNSKGGWDDLYTHLADPAVRAGCADGVLLINPWGITRRELFQADAFVQACNNGPEWLTRNFSSCARGRYGRLVLHFGGTHNTYSMRSLTGRAWFDALIRCLEPVFETGAVYSCDNAVVMNPASLDYAQLLALQRAQVKIMVEAWPKASAEGAPFHGFDSWGTMDWLDQSGLWENGYKGPNVRRAAHPGNDPADQSAGGCRDFLADFLFRCADAGVDRVVPHHLLAMSGSTIAELDDMGRERAGRKDLGGVSPAPAPTPAAAAAPRPIAGGVPAVFRDRPPTKPQGGPGSGAAPE